MYIHLSHKSQQNILYGIGVIMNTVTNSTEVLIPMGWMSERTLSRKKTEAYLDVAKNAVISWIRVEGRSTLVLYSL